MNRGERTQRGTRPEAGAGPPEEALADAIERMGLRHSRQRDVIARTFFAMGGHVPVEALVSRVREADPRVSAATVYRTMKLLSACGLAVPRDFGDGRARWEAATPRHPQAHDHLICTACGAIVEFESERIAALQDRLARRHGFHIERRRVELYGRCPACRARAEGETAA